MCRAIQICSQHDLHQNLVRGVASTGALISAASQTQHRKISEVGFRVALQGRKWRGRHVGWHVAHANRNRSENRWPELPPGRSRFRLIANGFFYGDRVRSPLPGLRSLRPRARNSTIRKIVVRSLNVSDRSAALHCRLRRPYRRRF